MLEFPPGSIKYLSIYLSIYQRAAAVKRSMDANSNKHKKTTAMNTSAYTTPGKRNMESPLLQDVHSTV